MDRLRTFGWLSVLALIAGGASYAQPVPLDRLDTRDGLSHNTVLAVAQDREGFLWIGTTNGLNRYDGYTFEVFHHDPGDPSSLAGRTVEALAVDAAGSLWGGTSGGLNRYDRRSGRFEHVALGGADGTRRVRSLAVDAAGALWIGAEPGELFRYDPASEIATHVLLNGLPTSLAVDAAGHVWVTLSPERGAPATTVQRYDPARGRFEQVAEVSGPSPRSLSVHTGTAGTVWAYTAGRPCPTAEALRCLPTLTDAEPAHAVVEDAEGRLWIGADGGLYRYDPARDALHRQSVDDAPTAWLSNNVQTLFRDRAGALWIGTLSGLYRHDPHRKPFVNQDVASEPGGRDGAVLAVHADPDGTLWAGTLGGGLVRQSPDGTTERYRVADGPGLGLVWALHEDRHGTLWLGLAEDGLCALDRRSGRLRCLDRSAALLTGDPEGMLWVAGNGLTRFDPVRRRVLRQMDWPIDETPLGGALHVDPEGTLWVGADGLYRCDADAEACRRPAAEAQRRAGLDRSSVYAIHEGAGGVLWLGTTRGLARFDPSASSECVYGVAGVVPLSRAGRGRYSQSPSPYEVGGGSGRGASPSTASREGTPSPGPLPSHAKGGGEARIGLPAAESTPFVNTYPCQLSRGRTPFRASGTFTNSLSGQAPASDALRTYFAAPAVAGLLVYSLLPDEQGRLWMGTSRGIARFDPPAETFRVYDPDERPGLPEFNRRAAFRRADGHLYFGHLDGVTHFDPAAIRDNPVRPPIAITRATRAGPDGPAALDLHRDEPLALSYRDRLLRVEFAALSFTRPEANRYRYRLDGFDDDWVEAGTERQAVYTNLAPGDYTFRVQGSNEDGRWSEEDATLALTVAPPFWQTAWFRALALLALAGLLLAAHRLRVAQLLRVERVRARISSDLHDEVGSKLASIALASETVERRAALPERERRQLDEIARTARRLAGDLRDIVWLANPRFDALDDLVEKMRTTAETLLAGTAHTFDCADGDGVRALDMERRRQLFLFYKETLRNVARHAGADRITIRVRCAPDALHLTVADDGAGFDLGATREATGLASLRERARALGGTVVIETAPGAGTTVRLVAPLRRMAGFRDGRRRDHRLDSSS